MAADPAINFHAGGEYRFVGIGKLRDVIAKADQLGAVWIELARSDDPGTDKMIIKYRGQGGVPIEQEDYHGCMHKVVL